MVTLKSPPETSINPEKRGYGEGMGDKGMGERG
jgi:hypothetical protein